VLQGVAGVGRQGVAPQQVDQPVGRDRLADPDGQQGQQRPLLGPGDRDQTSVVEVGLDGAQNPDLHGITALRPGRAAGASSWPAPLCSGMGGLAKVSGGVPQIRDEGEAMGARVGRGLAVLLVAGVIVAGCGADNNDGSGARAQGQERTPPTRKAESSAGTTAATDSSGCDAQGASTAEPDSTVTVKLAEFSVHATPDAVPAGTIELVAENQGSIFHELVVVRWDGDPGKLPLNQAGGADQTKFRDDIVGRIDDFQAHSTCRASFDLDPGRYALICNLVDDGFTPHYSQGMYTAFTVQ
jgi:hypothetical protein